MSINQGQPVKILGEKLETAKAVMILLHGRGDSAQGILSLVPEIAMDGFAYGAPNAAAFAEASCYLLGEVAAVHRPALRWFQISAGRASAQATSRSNYFPRHPGSSGASPHQTDPPR